LRRAPYWKEASKKSAVRNLGENLKRRIRGSARQSRHRGRERASVKGGGGGRDLQTTVGGAEERADYSSYAGQNEGKNRPSSRAKRVCSKKRKKKKGRENLVATRRRGDPTKGGGSSTGR